MLGITCLFPQLLVVVSAEITVINVFLYIPDLFILLLYIPFIFSTAETGTVGLGRVG